MPIYYMFLAVLLFVVLMFVSFKEGLEAEERANELYVNYDKIGEGLQDFNTMFKSFAKNK